MKQHHLRLVRDKLPGVGTVFNYHCIKYKYCAYNFNQTMKYNHYHQFYKNYEV